MSLEVLGQHLEYTISIWWVAASVTHGTPSAVQILPHHHGYFPHSWVRSGWTRWNHTVVEQFVVQGVGPAWWFVFIDGHGRVVGEVGVVQHLEHLISSHLKQFVSNIVDGVIR